jgi:membrane protein implicated in regulation of membrane protease activity
MSTVLELWQWALLSAFAFMIIEIFTTTFLFAGFAAGAFFLALIFLVGAPPVWLVLVLFGAVSAGSFVAFRRIFRKPDDQRIADDDVNRY